MASAPPPGLRERKRLRTRAEIQRRAMALFAELGYQGTTVQQIADAAEVSVSTFFRYFPTKAEVVLQDDFDPDIIERFRALPRELSAVAALRASIAAVLAALSAEERQAQVRRISLVMSEPELRASMLDQIASAIDIFAELVAERSGRSPAELEVRTVAGALIGAVTAVMFWVAADPSRDFALALDRSLARLEEGLAL